MLDVIKTRKFWLAAVLVGAAALIGITVYGPKAKAADKGGPKKQVAATLDDDLPPPPSWTGVYIGLHGGSSYANADLSYKTFGLDGLSATGMVGGGHVGARWHVPSSPLVVGARAGYTFGETEFNAGAAPAIFHAAIKESWSADGTLGLALGTAMPYVVLGYTKAETEASFGGTALKGVPDLKGLRYGVGVEFRLPKLDSTPVISTFALEYLYTDYDDLSFGKAPNALGVDVTGQTVLGRLNIQFGGR